jgi:hypothetical protein
MQTRTARVAAIQLESKHGSVPTNREHAAPFLEEAARAGAQLVVLPFHNRLSGCRWKNGITIQQVSFPA